MGSFGHNAGAPKEAEDLLTSARNARYGMRLFLLYFAFYAGFVGLNAFAPATMAFDIGGINLAIWYGLGLIVAAMVLAIIYTALCHRPARRSED